MLRLLLLQRTVFHSRENSFRVLLAVSIPAEAGTTKIMLNSVITEYPIGFRS